MLAYPGMNFDGAPAFAQQLLPVHYVRLYLAWVFIFQSITLGTSFKWGSLVLGLATLRMHDSVCPRRVLARCDPWQ